MTEIIPLFHISLDDKMVMEAEAYSFTNWTKSSMVLTVKSARYEDLVVAYLEIQVPLLMK